MSDTTFGYLPSIRHFSASDITTLVLLPVQCAIEYNLHKCTSYIYRRQEVILKRNIAVSQVDVCLSLVACLFEERNI